jgi:hypothetical protein
VEHSVPNTRFESEDEEESMAEDREKISNGPNERAINETIAGTGPGISDDALTPGENLPEAPSDEQVDEIARKMGAPTAESDTLPLDGE